MFSRVRQCPPQRNDCEKDSSDRGPQAQEQKYSDPARSHAECGVSEGRRMQEGCAAIHNQHETRDDPQNQESSTRSTVGKI